MCGIDVRQRPWRLDGREFFDVVASGLQFLCAVDLKTDQVAWTFDGETKGITRHYNGAASTGCCERPWTLPDGETLFVASSYSNWVYYLDAKTGKTLWKFNFIPQKGI